MPRRISSPWTRRDLLKGGALLAAQLARPAFAQQPQAPVFAYVGSFTTAQRYARGDGIHVYRVDTAAAEWTHVQHVGNLVNPSMLALRRDRRFLYSIHGDETYATAFSVDRQTGQLSVLNRGETGGRNGVYLAIDPAGRFLVTANYGSGSVSVLPVRADGSLGDAAQTIALQGQPGPHRVEQAASHPHEVAFDPAGRFVVVPDKGLDRIFVFAFDAATGKLTPTAQGSAVARPGSGPRHAAFHPTLPVLWVLNEIASTVVTYYWEAERGHLRPVQIVPALPADYTGENTSAEVVVSPGGRCVYCSNRGHDSVAVFSADPATGLLTSVQWAPSQGRTPRFMAFDPSHRFLYVANEQSDNIVPFRADPVTGNLTPAGQPIHNASPVAIAFAG